MPIFVAEDSADVWANPEQFQAGRGRQPHRRSPACRPTFSPPPGSAGATRTTTGTRCAGTASGGGSSRIQQTLRFVDIVRIDHFRGFAPPGRFPADEETAVKGKWVKAPGHDLFVAVQDALGDLPFIAEDLGVITPDVDALRLEFDLPGMKILQFAFGMEFNPKYLPHNFEHN